MDAKDQRLWVAGRGEDASEGQLFDELTKELASGAISRRRALKLAGAAILGSTGLLALFPGMARASELNVLDEMVVVADTDPGCRGEPAISNQGCRAGLCGGNQNCICAKTVSGHKRCVQIRDLRCPSQDRCDRNDCPQGKVCIQIGGCCGHPRRNFCVDLCGN
jgi:hypothetical protein